MQQETPSQDGQYGKTSQEHLTPAKALTLEKSWTQWQKQGRWSSNGNCWTANILESPNVDGECLLRLDSLLIPQTQVPAKYFLSTIAIKGILTRELKRCFIAATGRKTPSKQDSPHQLNESPLSVLLQKHLDQDS